MAGAWRRAFRARGSSPCRAATISFSRTSRPIRYSAMKSWGFLADRPEDGPVVAYPIERMHLGRGDDVGNVALALLGAGPGCRGRPTRGAGGRAARGADCLQPGPGDARQ